MLKEQTVEKQKLVVLGKGRVQIPQEITDTFISYCKAEARQAVDEIIALTYAGDLEGLRFAMIKTIEYVDLYEWEAEVLEKETYEDFLKLRAREMSLIDYRNKMRLISELFKQPIEGFEPEKIKEVFESLMTSAKEIFEGDPIYQNSYCWAKVVKVSSEQEFHQLKSSIEASRKLRREAQEAQRQLWNLERDLFNNKAEVDKFRGRKKGILSRFLSRQ